MASGNPSNPATWDEYEGSSPRRSGSDASMANRNVQWDEEPVIDRTPDERLDDEEWPRLRRRRSSLTTRLTALTDVGGVNSIRSFTRSWQRAAGFAEVIPQRPSIIFAPDQVPTTLHPPEAIQYGRSDVEAAPSTSLLRQHLEASRLSQAGESALRDDTQAPQPGASHHPHSPTRRASGDYREREAKALENELSPLFRVGSAGTTSGSIFAIPPHLATPPIMGSYGSLASRDYGTLRSEMGVPPPSMEEAAVLWRQEQEAAGTIPDIEVEPILVREVEQDGKVVLMVEGQSTLPQTIFNSINVLIGVGLLSLPMGIKYAGWLVGMISLFLCAAVTAYTAKLLARCMDLDASLTTFSDVAYISFGRNARVATSVLFTLELMAACVALIVLFADSLDLILPGLLTVTQWKMVCSAIMVPLNFLPLRLLSFTSIIGIVCCFSIVTILLIDGFIKPTSPGSLIEPAQTYLFPANWLTLPLSFGLLMSPWGGHSVFPNIYRDMRHPHKYTRALKVTFSFTYLLDTVTAVAGLLMFGDEVRDEITSNILESTGYPRALTALMCIFIAIIPLTKIPLNARPIISTAEVLLGLHYPVVSDDAAAVRRTAYWRGSLRILVRVLTILSFLIISILFPAFDSIMAFMGSALCYTICVTLPISFYLKLFGDEIAPREKFGQYTLLTLSIIISTVGTIWSFLPKSLIV
ncbi:hypothetical protein GQ53DRAFT_40407 [Thozetella sp. PMI_491]|nr:hypothetical protein GQ53DRAFT_40407 [Thozetella sp. PMI_491]